MVLGAFLPLACANRPKTGATGLRLTGNRPVDLCCEPQLWYDTSSAYQNQYLEGKAGDASVRLRSDAVQNRRWPVALFFGLLLALGIFTGADYGQPWDEPWEQDILRMNGNQYAAALGFSGRYALTSTMQGPESGLIADSVERDHGECAYYPLLWLMDGAGLTDAQRMVVWHTATWLWFMAGAGALWLIARRLSLSRVLSGATVLLLVFTPRMFAEGHYNNKDMVLLSLTLLTLWLALRLMEKPGVARALLFSLAGAAAANTKIVGCFCGGFARSSCSSVRWWAAGYQDGYGWRLLRRCSGLRGFTRC